MSDYRKPIATGWRCRRCQTPHDGMGTECPNCGTPQRIPVTFPNGHCRYLPRGMTLDGFDELLAELGELEATKALLEATQEQHRRTIADFCAVRNALPRKQVEQILAAVEDHP